MSAIPLGICREILLRLPAESLFRFRAVCKRWRSVIDDPCFVRAHTNNQLSSNNTIIIRNSTGPPFYPLYYFNLEALNFTNSPQTIPVTHLKLTRSGLSRLPALPVAACNGLMLIAPINPKKYGGRGKTWDREGTWEIWNPLTHERLKLPQPSINSQIVGYGLGYDCATHDYEVVVIDYVCHNKESLSQTHVYSLKSDSWRKIENCPFEFHNGDIQQGVFLNGALHWMSLDKIDMWCVGMTVLHLGTEKYRKLEWPLLDDPDTIQLDALGGCLLLSCNCKSSKHFDVWVMNDYGAVDSWVKLFSLDGHHVSYLFFCDNLRPVAYMKDEKRVLVQHNYGFFWFDVESNSVKTVSVHGIHRDSDPRRIRISAQICHGSLFRLHDSCGRAESKRRTRKSKREMKMTDTTLTFCVRDVDKNDSSLHPSHDCCYSFDSNWYNSSSEGDEVHTASFNPVPLDICRELFHRLPAKSLIRFRDVCQAWRAVIDDPLFVKAHTNKQLSSNSTIIIRNSTGPPFYPLYSFDIEALNFTSGLQAISAPPLDFTPSGLSRLPDLPVAACNGLMLIAPINPKKNWDDEINWDPKGTWELWNPLTHERLELPQLNFNSHSQLTAWGLGYDSSTDDYKAVVIDRRPRHEKHVYHTHVYSLKSDSWRKIGNCPCHDWRRGQNGPGVFLNGALHWIPWYTIIALDLGTENYCQLELPPLENGTEIFFPRKQIDVLGGCLILSDFFCDDYLNSYLDVWVMKDYGAEDSWVKLFSIDERQFHDLGCSIRPVAYMKNKMQIFLQDHMGFYLFDVNNNSGKMVSIHGLSGTLSAQIIPGSIFRLHDHCGVSGRRGIMKRTSNMNMPDTELTFCVRDDRSHAYESHDCCYSLDSKCYFSSSEDED